MIYRSQYPDVEIPNASFPTVALRNATRLASKPAFIDAETGRVVTYGELGYTVERVAAGLNERGVRKGDVVSMFAPNSIEYAIAFYSVTSLGAIAAPANPTWTVDELGSQLSRQSARFLLTTPALLDTVRAAKTPALRDDRIFVFGEHSSSTTFDDLLASTTHVPAVDIDPEHDIAALLCSSGTTGLPKSVMLSHRALVATGAIAAGPMGVEEQDVLPGHLPLFHAFGVFINLAAGPMAGATSIMISRFEFEPFLQLIQHYRMTRLFTPPPLIVQLAKNPVVENYDLSSLEFILSGAAPLGADIQELAQNRVGCLVKQGFGMSEGLPTLLSPNDLPIEKQGSSGKLTANTEARIVDPDSGRDLPVGERGELWMRGPQVMSGYLNDSAATAAALDSDGWLHTGDVAFADEDGYFSIVDRLKELIKYKGYQVAPAELEAVLLTHPAVADCAIVRFPDENAGEVPKAFVVSRAPVDAETLMAFVAERVATYKKIRQLEFIDVIPKSPSGKILRRELIARGQVQASLLV
jgi:acyl-CoA synthetase (AMP-forming)/AMP-acid ligase II